MKAKVLFLVVPLLLAALACSTVAFPAPDPTAIPPSAIPPTIQPAEAQPTAAVTSVPFLEPTQAQSISQAVALNSVPFNEESQVPPYTITAQTPNLTGSDELRVADFNSRMNGLVLGEVDRFRRDTLQYATNPPITGGSSFDVQYSLIGQAGDFWSIKFYISGYADGAAHPYHYSITVNYDLEQGREFSLGEIFLPNSNYLQKLSDYCKAELATRDIGFDMDIFAQGADPLPENYQRWNVSNEGLIITFDEYQVAPYAAGPQEVIIPFGELQGLIDPQGPLAPFMQ